MDLSGITQELGLKSLSHEQAKSYLETLFEIADKCAKHQPIKTLDRERLGAYYTCQAEVDKLVWEIKRLPQIKRARLIGSINRARRRFE